MEPRNLNGLSLQEALTLIEEGLVKEDSGLSSEDFRKARAFLEKVPMLPTEILYEIQKDPHKIFLYAVAGMYERTAEAIKILRKHEDAGNSLFFQSQRELYDKRVLHHTERTADLLALAFDHS